MACPAVKVSNSFDLISVEPSSLVPGCKVSRAHARCAAGDDHLLSSRVSFAEVSRRIWPINVTRIAIVKSTRWLEIDVNTAYEHHGSSVTIPFSSLYSSAFKSVSRLEWAKKNFASPIKRRNYSIPPSWRQRPLIEIRNERFQSRRRHPVRLCPSWLRNCRPSTMNRWSHSASICTRRPSMRNQMKRSM